MACTNGKSDWFRAPVTRYYVDIRPYAPINPEKHLKSTAASRAVEQLPLIDSLPQEKQEAIKKNVRKPDRYMSLASELLKYYFIHKTAKIPWSEVVVRRTPKPHGRPYWAAPEGWWRPGFEGIEFNVSHQAGMVVLVGCKTPSRPRDMRINDRSDINIQSPAVINPDPNIVQIAESEIDEDEPEDVRIGVDVACTWEPPRTYDLSTQEKLDEWVDIFGEMFSEREQDDMKYAAVSDSEDMGEMQCKARRFYTYWALKEAYIKMVGEGLLAPWLRELEFRDVPVPRTSLASRSNGSSKWTILDDETVNQLKILFKNRGIGHTMQTSLEAFEETFIVATMTRGVHDMSTDARGSRWQMVNFTDMERCAAGNCSCL